MSGTLEIPTIGSPNSTQDPKIKTAIETLNGLLNSENKIVGNADNAVYKTIATGNGTFPSESSVTKYFGIGTNLTTLGLGTALGVICFVPADYAVDGLTTKMRLRAQQITAATGPGVTLTVGVYTLAAASTVTGPSAGSTIAFVATAANKLEKKTSGDFAIPAEEVLLVVGVQASGATNAASAHDFHYQLQVRNV